MLYRNRVKSVEFSHPSDFRCVVGSSTGAVTRVDPSPQDRIYFGDYPTDGLGLQAAKYDLELAEQSRAFLHLGPIQRHPATRTTANATEVKAEKPEALSSLQIHSSTLLFIHFHFKLGKLLPQSLFHRRLQPTLFGMSAHQHHQIISKPNILDYCLSAMIIRVR